MTGCGHWHPVQSAPLLRRTWLRAFWTWAMQGKWASPAPGQCPTMPRLQSCSVLHQELVYLAFASGDKWSKEVRTGGRLHFEGVISIARDM